MKKINGVAVIISDETEYRIKQERKLMAELLSALRRITHLTTQDQARIAELEAITISQPWWLP